MRSPSCLLSYYSDSKNTLNLIIMKKHKFNRLTPGLSIFLLTSILILSAFNAKAQEESRENKLLKYELSIDLVPIIDQGQFGKVYFKMNHYKEDQLKGAYRIGVSKGSYFLDKLDRTNVPDNVYITPSKFSNFEANVYFGYEKYKHIGSIITYYGVDILGWYFKRKHTPIYMDDQRSMTFGFCPFWGVKHYLYKNRVSIAFEIGWENSINSLKNSNPSDGSKNNSFNSDLKLPCNLTFNYHL